MNRSKQFNYFTKGHDPKEKRKSQFKKYFKWIKAFFYLFIFGLTLTGCVQTFTIKTSSTVGNGFEIYKNKNEIAPRVTTFETKETNAGKNEINFNLLAPNNENHHVNLKEIEDKKFIEKLIKQTEQDGGEYGKYGEYSSSIRFSNTNQSVISRLKELGFVENGYEILEKDGRFLFKTSSATKYTRINEDQPIAFYTNGSIFALKLKSNKANDYQVENVNGKDSYVISNSYTGSLISSVELVNSATEEYNAEAFANKTANEKAAELSRLRSLANGAYDSDVLLTLYNYSFGPNSIFLQKVQAIDSKYQTVYQFVTDAPNWINQEVSDFHSSVLISPNKVGDLDNLLTQYNKKLTQAKSFNLTGLESFEEKINKLQEFTNEIKSSLNSENEESRAQVELTKEQKTKAQSLSTELSNLLKDIVAKDNLTLGTIEKNKYDLLVQYNSTLKSYLSIAGFQPVNGTIKVATQNGESVLALKGDAPQKPIYTWGQAWELGPFYGLLVYPLGALMQSIRSPLPSLNGWSSILAIIIAVILTRLVTLALTFRTTMMQSLQEELKTKKAAIEAKYKGFEDNKTMKLRKQQELSALNSKYNVNPLDMLGATLFQMPIFFAMWRVIQGFPEIKATVWLGLNFSSTSYKELLSGNFVYLWILIAVIAAQLASQLIPQWLNRKRLKERATLAEIEALKKSERTQKMMMIVFTVITVLFTAGVQVYWMFGGIWQIFQTIGIHYLKKTQWFKERYSKKAFKANK